MLVLYEDNHLIAVYKENNELVQGDITGDETLADRVKVYIKKTYKKPGDVFLGICHRIDRPVSGVVLFARTSKALARLNKMFQDGEITAIDDTYISLASCHYQRQEMGMKLRRATSKIQ